MAPTIRHCDASGNATAGCQEIGYVRTALRATRTEGALLLLAVSMCIFAIAEGGRLDLPSGRPAFFRRFPVQEAVRAEKQSLLPDFLSLLLFQQNPVSDFLSPRPEKRQTASASPIVKLSQIKQIHAGENLPPATFASPWSASACPQVRPKPVQVHPLAFMHLYTA